MTRLAIAFWILTSSASSAVLRTAQTELEFDPQPSAPRLLSLRLPGQPRWINAAPETLISSVEIAGKSVPVRWEFKPAASASDARHLLFVYESASPHLRLKWEWSVPAPTGPIEHTVRIQNLASSPIWLPLQDSFRFRWTLPPGVALQQISIEKGAGKPSPEGTRQVAFRPGDHWTGTSSTYAHPAAGEPREIIPWLAVERTGTAPEGWYIGVEFSGRTRLTLARDENSLSGAVGLNPDPGPFRSRLQPGETFTTPAIFLGAFQGGIDNLGNVLRPWVRQVLGNPRAWRNPRYPLAVNNSWGSGMLVDEALARRMIRDSADLGLDMFGLDAGWFRAVGDWVPDPNKFPHGLAALSRYAHQHALKFGIWVDWTQAGLSPAPGALNVHAPAVRDWLVSDPPPGWKTEPFKGQTIDIGVPAAQAYAQRQVDRLVDNFRLDMLEHDGYLVAQGCVRADHPHAPPDPAHTSITHEDGNFFVASSNSTDVSYHAVRAYYAIYARLRAQHPDLLLEICNDGGRMVDFGSAAHGDYFSITDSYDPLSNRQAFFDASHLLPPAMLEAYVEKWPAPAIENLRYMLRSGMLGWLTLMLDSTAWTPLQHAAAKEEIRLYQTNLRPLIRDADLYHITPRPDGIHWDGIEYFNPARQTGVVYAFRGSAPDPDHYTFPLQGLDPRARYALHFQDHSSPDRDLSGSDLLRSGLNVRLPVPESSELIFFTLQK